MRKAKKLIGIVLTLAMVLSMSMSVLAAEVDSKQGGESKITISNAKNGEEYRVYKMLNVTTDGKEAFSYTVSAEWEDFFTTGAGAAYFDVDANGTVTIKEAYSETDDIGADLAKAALSYAADQGIDPVVKGTADDSGITFTNLDEGWYLVDTSLGSLCSIGTIPSNQTIQEKNPEPTVEKEEKDPITDKDWTMDDTANVGDTVNYEVFIKDVANSSSLCMHDELSTGLTFFDDSVQVYYAVVTDPDVLDDLYHAENIDWTFVDPSQVTWTENDDCSDGCTFELSFSDDWLANLKEGTVIKVTYDAEVNETAVDTGNFYDIETNKVHLTYGSSSFSTTITTVTDTVGFDLKKVDDEENQLTGAEFKLYSDEELAHVIQFTSDGDIYEVATPEQAASGEVTTTIEAGDVEILGLSEGTYYLVETKAPDGYNKLTKAIEITISLEENAGGTYETVTVDGETVASGVEVDVINNAGSILPGTGGMGTTIFYVIGVILVLGAAIVLVTRRRMVNAEK